MQRREMEKKAPITTILFLSQAIFLSAFPFLPPATEEPKQNSTVEGSGGSGEGANEEEVPLNSINDYVFRFFLNQRELKKRNCSTQFLGQSVSRHLCNSTKAHFFFPEGKKYFCKQLNKQQNLCKICAGTESNETTETQKKYELCASEKGSEAGQRLGYDIVLYMRPHSDTTQRHIVVITEFVHEEQGQPWEQTLAHTITRGDSSSGWQVIHLHERRSTNITFCFNISVWDSARGRLNRSSISEVFVTDRSRPLELNVLPVIVKYTSKQQTSSGVSPFVPSPDPFPFFGHFTTPPPTEAPTESRRKRSNECTLEDNPVNLYFPNSPVVAPRRANINRCFGGAAKRLEPQEEEKRQFLEGVCRPTQFEDLNVLRYSQLHNSFFTDIIPNAIIKQCGHVVPT